MEHRTSQPFVCVVVLTWNRREDALSCLESLSQMTYPRYRLLLVDNASADGTVEAVKARFPEVELIVNSRDMGFGAGFNTGLRHALEAGADYIFMINNDTFVDPRILDELMAHADPPDVGILAPKIYYAAERDRIWSVGAMKNPWTLGATDTGDRQLDHGQWDKVIERDYLTGCALLLKRSLLEQVGLFDADRYYPIYCEDTDLCLRARQAGFRLLMVPSARMWHKVSASGGGVDSPEVCYLRARNNVRLLRKHVRGWRWLTVVPYNIGVAGITTLRLLYKGAYRSIGAYWRGLRAGLT